MVYLKVFMPIAVACLSMHREHLKATAVAQTMQNLVLVTCVHPYRFRSRRIVAKVSKYHTFKRR